MTDLPPGSRWLLPVEINFTSRRGRAEVVYVKYGDVGERVFFEAHHDDLIPADRITELEAEVERLKAKADNQGRRDLEFWYSGIRTAVTLMHEAAKLFKDPGARAAMNATAHALAATAKAELES